MELDQTLLEALSKEDINRLPLKRYNGLIKMVRTPRQMEAALKSLKKERVLGFDTETKPCFIKGVQEPLSLLQLAASNRVYVFQFQFVPFNGSLADIMADADVVKTGVAVRDDIKGLQDLSAFDDAGFVDLGEVAREAGAGYTGLRNLAAAFLGVRISKSMRVSNWGRRDLTKKQIVYAATDAWISRELYLKFSELGLV
jgi:ribonuclease D